MNNAPGELSSFHAYRMRFFINFSQREFSLETFPTYKTRLPSFPCKTVVSSTVKRQTNALQRTYERIFFQIRRRVSSKKKSITQATDFVEKAFVYGSREPNRALEASAGPFGRRPFAKRFAFIFIRSIFSVAYFSAVKTYLFKLFSSFKFSSRFARRSG